MCANEWTCTGGRSAAVVQRLCVRRLLSVSWSNSLRKPARDACSCMIELRMLGEIRLRTDSPDGVEVAALLGQPKRLALLAYLASPAPGTWHRRDMLLALFWPELDAAHARTAL